MASLTRSTDSGSPYSRLRALLDHQGRPRALLDPEGRDRLPHPLWVVPRDPRDPRVLVEPRVLAPGEATGGLGGGGAGLVLGEVAGEVGRDLAVADGPNRGE